MAILLIDHELLYQTNEVRGAARMSPEKKSQPMRVPSADWYQHLSEFSGSTIYNRRCKL